MIVIIIIIIIIISITIAIINIVFIIIIINLWKKTTHSLHIQKESDGFETYTCRF